MFVLCVACAGLTVQDYLCLDVRDSDECKSRRQDTVLDALRDARVLPRVSGFLGDEFVLLSEGAAHVPVCYTRFFVRVFSQVFHTVQCMLREPHRARHIAETILVSSLHARVEFVNH